MSLKKKLKVVFILFSINAFSQNWELVWSDEFTNEIGSDWVFETGRGSGGWGNNELQYYREENATVENGSLVITAKKENFSGADYTSVRMKTQGLKSWTYGKIEARILFPSFQGSWPAFWMLGENISSVGWPACGEIDILEHVNVSDNVHGTIHWQDHNGQYANYGKGIVTDTSGYHTYGIEWDDQVIKWFIDDVQYHIVNIENGVNGTSEFHEEFFILLNLAIGGNWPGFDIDDTAFPTKMYIDYVRVYQNAVSVNSKDVITSDSLMMIYPNPASDFITIESDGYKYIITNVLGTQIDLGIIENRKTYLSLNKYAEGIYHISIFNDKNELLNFKNFVIK